MADNTSGFFSNPVVKWIEYRLPVFSTIDHMVGTQYPTPKISATGGTSVPSPVCAW